MKIILNVIINNMWQLYFIYKENFNTDIRLLFNNYFLTFSLNHEFLDDFERGFFYYNSILDDNLKLL